MRARYALIAAISFPAGLYACGLDSGTVIATTPGADDGGVSGDGAIGDGANGADSGSDGGSRSDSGSGGDSGVDSGPGPDKIVYANTESDIWSYDVTTSVLTKIAPIGCAGSHPADLAIDTGGQA